MSNVHEIKRTSLLDVPEKLRELANYFEANPDIKTCVVVLAPYPGGRVAVRGFGERTSSLEACGWLHRGLDALTDGAGFDTLVDTTPDHPAA